MKCEFCDNEVPNPKLRCIDVCYECERKPTIGFWSMVISGEEEFDRILNPGAVFNTKEMRENAAKNYKEGLEIIRERDRSH